MATLLELIEIKNGSTPNDLMSKIAGAALVKASAVLLEASPPASRLEWAQATFGDPIAAADSLLGAVLGANSAASVAQITGADDPTIQANVNDAVDALYSA